MSETILRSAALKAARKRIPVVGDKKLEENLSFAAESKAEAYRIGVEEAQWEILGRIAALPIQPVTRPGKDAITKEEAARMLQSNELTSSVRAKLRRITAVAPFHTRENPIVEQQTSNSALGKEGAVVSTES